MKKDKEIINWLDSDVDLANVVTTVKRYCKVENTAHIAMRIVRDFWYNRKEASVPNPSVEYRMTDDLYEYLNDLCESEDCKNGCQLMQEPDGTYYFQITGAIFYDTEDNYTGINTVKVYFKEFTWSVVTFDDKERHRSVPIKYRYRNGACSFMIDGIEIIVLDCRDMRKDPSINLERYSDVCILSVSYRDESDCFLRHIIPNTWLYGSTSSKFDEGQEVHPEFINAAREYIKEHAITKEMQEVPDD